MLKKIIIVILALFLAAPVTLADDSSIVPVLLLFCQNQAPKWEKEFKDISSITQYDANNQEIYSFHISGSDIYQYDANNQHIADFSSF